jgi:hypothetical protein
MTDKRKELSNEYKSRKLRGGVYTITNTINGRYLLAFESELASALKRFNFLVATGSCVPLKMQKDWAEFGAKTFEFKVLEEIEMKPDQSQSEFTDDLKTLVEIWRQKLDVRNEY